MGRPHHARDLARLADWGMPLALTLVPIVVGFGLMFVILLTVRKRLGGTLPGIAGMSGGAAKQAEAQRLQSTGRKARATIINVQPTGAVVNHVNLGLRITFTLAPLDGGAPFQADKTVMLSQANIPRVGDVWPAWIDPADPTTFAVAAPGGASPDQVALWREFGIPHPLDQGAAAPAAPMAAPLPPSPAGGVDRLGALERLAALHRDGALSDAEFAAEKARLLS